MRMRRLVVLLLFMLPLAGCASVGELVQPPRIAAAENREAELRLLLPSRERPLGGAAIRLWAHVQNPNTFGFTLAALAGDLFLEGTRAAQVDFPLGVPLAAQQDTVIPLDLVLNLSDLPELRNALTEALLGQPVDYRMSGTVAVDAGPFGQPRFGPMTLLQGQVTPRR